MTSPYPSSHPLTWSLWQTSMRFLLLVFAAYAWFATPAVLLRSVRPSDAAFQLLAGCVGLIILAGLVIILRRRTRGSWVARVIPERNILTLTIVGGSLLRLLWCLACQASPASDGATYISLALQMLSGDGYGAPGARAYWPPGYPLFMVPFLAIMPANLAIPLTQTALFAIATVGVYRLTALLSSVDAAKVAIVLFAVWPNLVTLCATPEKEMLVLTLLVWSCYLLMSVHPLRVLLGGVLLGCATLCQPSVQLLVPTACLFLMIRYQKRGVLLAAMLVLGAVLAISPWTVRNYLHFNTFKMISTNGGDNLYRANNPLATGAYTDRGEIDLSALPELEFDAGAKSLAIKWITEHPQRFLALGIEKQMLFMGDDAYGVYATFRKDSSSRMPTMYAGLKMLANAWWLLIWLALALLIVTGERLGSAHVLVVGWLYLFALHSVFESTGKYHVPMLWVLCILVGVLVANVKRGASARSIPE